MTLVVFYFLFVLCMHKKYASFVKDDTVYEMVYNRETGKSEFVYLDRDGNLSRRDSVDTTLGVRETVHPFPGTSHFVRSGMVLFPSDAIEYDSEDVLIHEIAEYIDTYVELSSFMKQIVPHYVLLTWIYDDFQELPYLRVLGDYGTGKSRFLKTVGSLCYKPMFTIGATSDASIFRILEEIKGTLIIDEADFKYSSSNDAVVQILNSGYQRDFPVYRCLDGKGGFDVRPYHVFGPKIIAGRHPFQDVALESRCLVEKMGRMLREDIPTNLSEDSHKVAEVLRNKLLMWRLRNIGKRETSNFADDLQVEPRLKQIIHPLGSVISNKKVLSNLKKHVVSYNQELIEDRGFTVESSVLVEILLLMTNTLVGEITLTQVVNAYNATNGQERKMSSRKMGGVVRKQLGIKTYRKNLGYVLDMNHLKKELPSLCVKYGINREQVNIVNEDGLAEELKQMGLSVE